uniref:Uncharacterized protein n=1 Tax=Engystomops pustulosus TaxID=76066 RepID=A0AAV6YT75_ENGPU|nr:hypothetical protein GDO81_025317 [Engystomops pustulosus]
MTLPDPRHADRESKLMVLFSEDPSTGQNIPQNFCLGFGLPDPMFLKKAGTSSPPCCLLSAILLPQQPPQGMDQIYKTQKNGENRGCKGRTERRRRREEKALQVRSKQKKGGLCSHHAGCTEGCAGVLLTAQVHSPSLNLQQGGEEGREWVGVGGCCCCRRMPEVMRTRGMDHPAQNLTGTEGG